jgi:periplasmic copper chaperone A
MDMQRSPEGNPMKLKFFWMMGLLLAAAGASAQVARVDSPWARATVEGQTQAGVFMRLMSRDGAQLIGGVSPISQSVELYDMRTEKGAMQRQRVPFIDLPAGRTVELNECGPHILLVGLKQPVTRKSNVVVTLIFKDRAGVESRITVQAQVFGSAAELNGLLKQGVVVGFADPVANCSSTRVG